MKLGAEETNIAKAVIATLRPLGIILWRRNVGAIRAEYRGRPRFIRFASPGMSDLYGIGPAGVHWEIEIKRPGRRPRLNQIAWLRAVGELGAVAYWVDNERLAGRVARAILEGGRIKWYDNSDYDVTFPFDIPPRGGNR